MSEQNEPTVNPSVDPDAELADYIAKCRAMHRSHVAPVPRFAHAVAALADKLDEAEQSRAIQHAAAEMALDQRDTLKRELYEAQRERQRELELRCKIALEAEDMAMLLKRMARLLPADKTIYALDYLRATGRLGSPLRDAATVSEGSK